MSRQRVLATIQAGGAGGRPRPPARGRPTAPCPPHRLLALTRAGGAGGRMDVLTRELAKPALPFAGVFQLVDFPLSNLAHSDISQVWLSLQYQGHSLAEAVANGRPW